MRSLADGYPSLGVTCYNADDNAWSCIDATSSAIASTTSGDFGQDVDPPRLKRDEIRPLDREQVRRLLETAEGDRLHAFYVVAVTAGLRPSEMLALRWSDVDLEAGTLRINRALSGGEFAATKTSRSRRKIELSNTARAALRTHRKR